MDILLRHHIVYTIAQSRQQVMERIARLGDDYAQGNSDAMQVRLKHPYQFSITAGQDSSLIRWVERGTAYIHGSTTERNGLTTLYVTLRPNSAFVIFVYALSLGIAYCVVALLRGMAGNMPGILVMLLTFNIILLAIAHWLKRRLLRRFEEGLALKHTK